MKRIASLVLCFIILSSVFSFVCAEENQNVKVYVNEKEVYMLGAEPYMKNDRVMVPFRAIGEAMGANVFWTEHIKAISAGIITSDYIYMQIGNETYYVDGEERVLDVPPELHDSFTFVPVRFFAEAAGADVLWDETTSSVYIKYDDIFNSELSKELCIENGCKISVFPWAEESLDNVEHREKYDLNLIDLYPSKFFGIEFNVILGLHGKSSGDILTDIPEQFPMHIRPIDEVKIVGENQIVLCEERSRASDNQANMAYVVVDKNKNLFYVDFYFQTNFFNHGGVGKMSELFENMLGTLSFSEMI